MLLPGAKRVTNAHLSQTERFVDRRDLRLAHRADEEQGLRADRRLQDERGIVSALIGCVRHAHLARTRSTRGAGIAGRGQ